MSTLTVNDGKRIAYTNGATAVAAGTLIHIGSGIAAVADYDLAASASGTLDVSRQTLTVTTDATAIGAGAKFYLTTVTNTISSATTSGTQILNWFNEAAVTTAITSARITKI